ncbi:MAG: hypothetical protein UX62_C0003G0003 [Microgenomates group bacterium GW2011_GWA2_46_7]|nr:MAG: hypothetical protein UX62_C0003G0003 [Microgenomates group bacterium GW2011_GWA2_46_7]
MGHNRQELVYEDIGDWRAEEAGREDPNIVEFTQAGAKRRTSFTREAVVEGGPNWVDGARTAWYIVVDQYGDTRLVAVNTSTELASLPANALPAGEYANQLAAEAPSLAADLFAFLAEAAESHPAHHTTGADVGPRTQAIFRREQLNGIGYQDPQIGKGITVPPARHHTRNPVSMVGADQVKW